MIRQVARAEGTRSPVRISRPDSNAKMSRCLVPPSASVRHSPSKRCGRVPVGSPTLSPDGAWACVPSLRSTWRERRQHVALAVCVEPPARQHEGKRLTQATRQRARMVSGRAARRIHREAQDDAERSVPDRARRGEARRSHACDRSIGDQVVRRRRRIAFVSWCAGIARDAAQKNAATPARPTR